LSYGAKVVASVVVAAIELGSRFSTEELALIREI
jgi:hypothetical protein